MRLKTATARDLKPGMVVRTRGVDSHGLDLTPFRQVAAVNLSIWHNAVVTFTDGTRAYVGSTRDFEIATGKRVRNTAIRKAALRPTAFDAVTATLRAYAAA